MMLSGSKIEKLRDLGWSVVRRKSRRPMAIPASDILHVDRDIAFEATDEASRLQKLENKR